MDALEKLGYKKKTYSGKWLKRSYKKETNNEYITIAFAGKSVSAEYKHKPPFDKLPDSTGGHFLTTQELAAIDEILEELRWFKISQEEDFARKERKQQLTAKLYENLDWLYRHNKNYTKEQYYRISDLLDDLNELYDRYLN